MVDVLRRRTHTKGLLTGKRQDAEIYAVAAASARTLTVAESGKRIIQATAGTPTYTLPAVGPLSRGCEFTFVCANVAGEILITPPGTGLIKTKAANDAGASVAPAAGTGIKNTSATNVLGDYITLVFDGLLTWYTVAQSGIWASQ